MLTFPKGAPLFLPSFIPSIQQRPHKVPLTNVVLILRHNAKLMDDADVSKYVSKTFIYTVTIIISALAGF